MTRLRVATWNVHGGVGLDRRYAPGRIADVVGELDADVVAINEFGSRPAARDLRAHLEHAHGVRALVMPTFVREGCDFGNALLSRLPIVSSACHDLSHGMREPRNALDAIVEHAGGRLRILATHLGLRASERRAQVARLASVLAEGALPTVLLGDFNEWRRGGLLKELDGRFGMAHAPATFPSPCAVAALDRIWCAPAAALVDLRVHRSRRARVASDHLPLVATLEV
jgi:endonuclease/exonuclease/phosphatase family metal-dependent hydrolase